MGGQPSVSVLIPFASTDRWRQQALEHVTAHYQQHDWEVVIGTTEPPWRKAVAVEHAARKATGGVLVIADADCICHGTADAVQSVTDGAPWAVPHLGVYRLDQASTIARYQHELHEPTFEQTPYRGYLGGGIVVLPAATWQQIPLDPRFHGWGQEDASWALALTALAGEPVRHRHDLIHLWHPPAPRASRAIGSDASDRLYQRYLNARRQPGPMRTLIDEAKEVLRGPNPADDPGSDDHDRHAVTVGR